MLGPQNMNLSVKDEKLQKIRQVNESIFKYIKIKKGFFDDRYVTMEVPPNLIDDKKFESLDSLLEYIRTYSNLAE